MKKAYINILSIIASILMISSVQAHDPSKHKKVNAERPNCEAMKDMDHSKMDMKDPVAQAMMKKCQSAKSDEDTGVEGKKNKKPEETKITEHNH